MGWKGDGCNVVTSPSHSYFVSEGWKGRGLVLLATHFLPSYSFPHTPSFRTTERRTSMALLSSPFRAFAMVIAVFSSLFTVFTLTAWLTVAHDAQLLSEQNSGNGAGVSLHYSTICDSGACVNRVRHGSYGLLDMAIGWTWRHANCLFCGN